MMTNAIADALDAAIKAVRGSMPSLAPAIAVKSVRKTTDGGTRPVEFTMPCVLVEAEAEQAQDFDAPSLERQFTAYITREGWREETPPQIGDWFLAQLPKEAAQSWLKVTSVRHMVTGDFRLSLSYEPKRRPPWSV